MRRLVCAAALLAAIGTARADDARIVPALGAKLTYRFITTKTATGTVTAGEVYTNIVTASDATGAEGVIKPVAVVIHCTGGAADLGCRDASEMPGAHFDGELLTVPIAGDAGDALAKQSGFKYSYFIQVLRKFPVPGSRDPNKPNPGDIGPDPTLVLTNTLQCDFAGMPAFLPIGKAPRLALPCETTFERSATRDGKFPAQTIHDKVTLDISYNGSGWVTLPSGNWQVQKLAVKIAPADPSHPTSESESLFSTQLGATVKLHTIGTNPAGHSTTEISVELISVSP
jgi:hypothetical protein